ncbi:hypothetical protein LP032_106 [Listeria phage LP-032]|uniref:Uncharacterized protein n=2 Tax=Homburgvirus LP26 TaxID=1921126 RepID=A0A059TAK9_9CAUD|nr:hypothetical protein LP026_059 [Listeria phage LP-026]AHL18955.1 hypothetical protein LP032_106 [Listeria phage LP-032]AHN84753.1 hypothetical protein LP026_059 [Listeria phage LP-026]
MNMGLFGEHCGVLVWKWLGTNIGVLKRVYMR